MSHSRIRKWLMYCSIGLCAFWLSGCGGGEDTTSSGSSSSASSASSNSSSSSSSSSSSGSSGPVGDAVTGASLFAMQCANCHKTESLGLSPYTLESLTQKIDATMPIQNPGACDAQCSADIAAFIAIDNPNFGKDPNNNEGISEVEPAEGEIDPAPVVLNRLNNEQYNNTVRDLLGTSLTPADEFVEDGRAFGFYNTIAGSLTMSLAKVEQYVAAADVLANEVIAGLSATPKQRLEAETQTTALNMSVEGTLLTLRATGSQMISTFTGGGSYRFVIRAGQDAAGDEAARMRVLVDGSEIGATFVQAPRTSLTDYTFTANLPAGSHTLVVEFTNDLFVEGQLNRNLVLDWVDIESQSAAVATNVIPCALSQGVTCARSLINDFGPKAWRRPLSNEEKTAMEAVYQKAKQLGASEEAAFGQLIKAFILSSNFIYRPEIDPNPTTNSPRMLNSYELASRLSYFIWNSMPDKTLFDLAANGSLQNETVLREQVRRMVADPKATDAIAGNFLAQWLKIDGAVPPSDEVFPNFGGQETIDLMKQETKLFLRELFSSNAPISDVVNADYTYLNGKLAQFYGVTGISGDQFVRHQWTGEERRGILGQGSFLVGTSYADRTTPTKRGAYIMENLICKIPDSAPGGIVVNIDLNSDFTIREQLDLHKKAGTSCHNCHHLMDPLGYGLENFSATGEWRLVYKGKTIDASGTLPDGEQFNGALELSETLAQSPRLALCAIDHMMTYAIGRGLEAFKPSAEGDEEPHGYPAVYEVFKRVETGGKFNIHSIVEEIVLSSAFRMRRGADSEEI